MHLSRAVAASILGLLAATQVVFAQEGVSRPAPTEDHVGYPADYASAFTPMYVFDRADNRQVRIIYGNDPAVSRSAGQPFPYGSILVMETHRAMLDEDGIPLLDENGRFVPGAQAGLFVMRKEPGFGAEYERVRTGEWEYAQFALDGTLAPPQNSFNCASCHADAGATRDWTWRTDLYAQNRSGALPTAALGAERFPASTMQAYTLVPSTNTIRAGTIFTWTNADSAVHDIVLPDLGVQSGRLGPGQTFSVALTEPGSYSYLCSIHPTSMRGMLDVTP